MHNAILIGGIVLCVVAPFGLLAGRRYLVAAQASIREVWGEARTWERVLLIALIALPMPGPLDELGAIALAHRIHRRATRRG